MCDGIVHLNPQSVECINENKKHFFIKIFLNICIFSFLSDFGFKKNLEHFLDCSCVFFGGGSIKKKRFSWTCFFLGKGGRKKNKGDLLNTKQILDKVKNCLKSIAQT